MRAREYKKGGGEGRGTGSCNTGNFLNVDKIKSRFFKILVVLGLLIDSRCCCVCVGIKKLKKLQKNDNEIIKVIIHLIINATYIFEIFL